MAVIEERRRDNDTESARTIAGRYGSGLPALFNTPLITNLFLFLRLQSALFTNRLIMLFLFLPFIPRRGEKACFEANANL